MRALRLALVLPVLLAGLSGCLRQPEEANDNPAPRQNDMPSLPPPIEQGPSDAPS